MHTYKINATKKLVNAMSYEKHSKKKATEVQNRYKLPSEKGIREVFLNGST